jgi:hypothetical protein
METRPLKQSVKNDKVYCAVVFVPLYNRQFQLLVYACREGWEVRYHIAYYAEKNKTGGRVNTE